jgi:hypothetical protein
MLAKLASVEMARARDRSTVPASIEVGCPGGQMGWSQAEERKKSALPVLRGLDLAAGVNENKIRPGDGFLAGGANGVPVQVGSGRSKWVSQSRGQSGEESYGRGGRAKPAWCKEGPHLTSTCTRRPGLGIYRRRLRHFEPAFD